MYCIADVETTGVRPTDKIVELAYIIVDNDFKEFARGESLIDPQMPIPSGASAVNGITNAMVANEPTIEEFMEINMNPLAGGILVAHNSAFDFRYLGPWMGAGADHMCTVRLARLLYPEADSHKLGALKYSLDLPDFVGDAHRAMADVEMLLNLVKRMCKDANTDIAGLRELSKKPIPVKNWKFGKFKGQPVAGTDLGYVRWVLEKVENLDPDLRATLVAML